MTAPRLDSPNPVQHARDLIRLGRTFAYAVHHAFDVGKNAINPRPLTDLELSWISAALPQ